MKITNETTLKTYFESSCVTQPSGSTRVSGFEVGGGADIVLGEVRKQKKLARNRLLSNTPPVHADHWAVIVSRPIQVCSRAVRPNAMDHRILLDYEYVWKSKASDIKGGINSSTAQRRVLQAQTGLSQADPGQKERSGGQAKGHEAVMTRP